MLQNRGRRWRYLPPVASRARPRSYQPATTLGRPCAPPGIPGHKAAPPPCPTAKGVHAREVDPEHGGIFLRALQVENRRAIHKERERTCRRECRPNAIDQSDRGLVKRAAMPRPDGSCRAKIPPSRQPHLAAHTRLGRAVR